MSLRVSICLIALLLTLPFPLAAVEPLLIAIDKLATSYPDYAVVREGQPVGGQLVRFWQCVFDGLGRPVRFTVRPGARGRHELATGEVDLLVPKIKPSTDETVELGAAVYTQPYDYINYLLIARQQNKALLKEVNWVERNLGVARTSVLHTYLAQLGGHIGTQVNSVEQLLRLLLGGLVELVLMISPWPAAELRQFEQAQLAARGLLQTSVHALLSRQRHQREPQLLWQINRQISDCQLAAPIAMPNPFL